MNKTKNFSKIKAEFPFFKKNRNLVFFDNAATSLKPKVVIDAVNDYYQNYGANIHTQDFPLAVKTKEVYESCRQDVADFINAQKDEVVFCPSTTFALNQIAYSLEQYLTEGDEIVLTMFEHSSLLLPFYRLAAEKKVILKFIDVASDGLITEANLKKVLTKKTRLVAFANMNNSLGTINDVKKLTKVVKNFKIAKKSLTAWPFAKALVLVDGAQAVNHLPTNVKQWDIDFFTFSAHKLFGPTGIAVWWTKAEWLALLQPLILGGGMNGRIYKDGSYTLVDGPDRFEGGTPNIAGVFGLKAAIKYLTTIGIGNIYQYEQDLKEYALKQLKAHFADKIVIYNQEQKSGMILFNVVNVAAEEVASYLGKEHIALRSGNFCAKLLAEKIPCASSLRISFSIYNNKKDVDRLILALQKGFENGGDFLNEFFE